MRLSRRESVVIAAAAVLIAVAGVWQLVVVPVQEHLALLDRQLVVACRDLVFLEQPEILGGGDHDDDADPRTQLEAVPGEEESADRADDGD